MKRLIALLLVLVMGLTLVACGGEEEKKGPDKQPCIDKFNETSNNFNAVAATINENIDMFDDEVITTMTDMANLLNEYKTLLSGDDEIAQGVCAVKNLATGEQVSLTPDEAAKLILDGTRYEGSVIIEK